MKKQNHVHKLRRHSYNNGTKVFFCTLPDCNYKVDTFLALGKKAICHLCNDEFIMTEYTVKLARPHCQKCGKMKIKTASGEVKFINKNRPIQALAELGQTAVASLRERLGSVVTMEKDEDI
jgi:hypothetical protein